MTQRWNYLPISDEQRQTASALAKTLGISPILGCLLVERGIYTEEDAEKFFRPKLTHLHDPFLMKDMDLAVERLNMAMGRKERILVYGDYDVDGTTAVALVYKFLQQFYSNIDYYIPDRYSEGYGVTPEGVQYAKDTGATLVIVLDCGIKAVKDIARGEAMGIDFIICDHHVPDDVLPPAYAILNAKRKDNTYPFEHLSGCGVGFKLMQAFAINNGIEQRRLTQLLDLVVVSIASDLVPMVGENRVLAWYGLKRINSNPSIGMKAIIDVCGLQTKDITINDIVFKIGPRINASGRVQNGKETVDLLVEKDFAKAHQLAHQINEYNETRKDLDKNTTEQANEIVENQQGIESKRAIVLYNPKWHRGIIGIVASRLTELYCRPAIVLSKKNGKATGSARSVAGFDIYKALDSCRDLLDDFGGHTYACGLSMDAENVEEFTRRFEAYAEAHIQPQQIEASINISQEIEFKDISGKFYQDLKRFNPYGPLNEKPIFCTRNVYDYGTSKVVGHDQEHIKLELIDNKTNKVMDGIAFGQSAAVKYIKSKSAFDICYTIEENSHKRGEVQLQIVDIRPT